MKNIVNTPTNYAYDVEKVNKIQSHRESKNSFQNVIDELLLFKIKNSEISINDIIIYAEGLLRGRTTKASTLQTRKELRR